VLLEFAESVVCFVDDPPGVGEPAGVGDPGEGAGVGEGDTSAVSVVYDHVIAGVPAL